MSIKPLTTPEQSSIGGLLLLDKPQNFTSSDMVAIARRALHTRCIGHSGTLDPMATGLLILLINRCATRLQNQFLTLDKTYRATLQLGAQTDTWDAQGAVVKTAAVPPLTLLSFQQAAHTLTGKIRQPIPPFSAKKINGRKMYDLAREGTPVTDRFNEVTLYDWSDWEFNGKDQVSFTLHCSCGTYVRSVAMMLAAAVGTLGHLTALRRLSIGRFQVEHAFDGKKLKTSPQAEIVKYIQEPIV